MYLSLNRLFYATGLFFASIVIGILGFVIIEGFSVGEAFYMSVITISTVGFTEVRPLSNPGRVFTAIYIIINLGIFAYIVSVITSYLFEGEFRKAFKNYIIGREVKKLKNHVIVCGLGRNGSRACQELSRNEKDFVVIETDQEIISSYFEQEKFQFIHGDATDDDSLKEARIEHASTLITTLPRDADNVFIALTARELNPDIQVIARASEIQSKKKLERAGATHVILPDELGGMHMAQLVTKPYVVEFLEILNGIGDQSLLLEEISYWDLKLESRGKTLRELDIRNKTGVTILAHKLRNGGFDFSPRADVPVTEKDVLIMMGTEESLSKFKFEYCY